MRVVAGIFGCLLLAGVLRDGFNTVILARRMQRVLAFTRIFYRLTWRAFAALARRIQSGRRREDFLSIFGPFSFLALLGCWAMGLLIGFGLLQWAIDVRLNGLPSSLFNDLYFSGTTLFTVGSEEPQNPASKILMILESGLGISFLGLVVGYLRLRG